MEIKNKSFYNLKARPHIRENSNSWIPPSSYAFLLWPFFAVSSVYRNEYWVKHTHYESAEVLSVEEGEIELVYNGRNHQIKAGEVAFIPPGGRKLGCPPNVCASKRSVGIQGILLGLMLQNLSLTELTVFRNFVTPEFDSIYTKIEQLIHARDPQSIPKLSELAYALLIYVAKRREKSDLPVLLLQCQEFINQNIFQKISLEDICEEFSCSKTTLNRLFKKHFQSTPGEYLIDLRINYAKRLLAGDRMPIKEIAQMCGYQNQLYFSNDFKRRTGLSPSQFRKQRIDFHCMTTRN